MTKNFEYSLYKIHLPKLFDIPFNPSCSENYLQFICKQGSFIYPSIPSHLCFQLLQALKIKKSFMQRVIYSFSSNNKLRSYNEALQRHETYYVTYLVDKSSLLLWCKLILSRIVCNAYYDQNVLRRF